MATIKGSLFLRLRRGRLLRVLGLLSLLTLVLVIGINSYIRGLARHRMYYHADDVPASRVAIVFGASVHQNTLSDMLQDRVETGIDLYRKGKVRKLLMTGDNRFRSYNEPLAMKKYAIARGVPARDIVLDYAGRNTYDSCYRARAIFGIDSAVLVTQSYHLPRALYLARAMGIEAVGARAERHTYRGQLYYSLREQLALFSNWVKIHITKPVPILGQPLPIEGGEASVATRAGAGRAGGPPAGPEE